jgi:hypothetical protein
MSRAAKDLGPHAARGLPLPSVIHYRYKIYPYMPLYQYKCTDEEAHVHIRINFVPIVNHSKEWKCSDTESCTWASL